jgi:hypothetical protein
MVVAWWTLEGVGTALESQTFTVVACRCTCIVTSPRSGGDMDTLVVFKAIARCVTPVQRCGPPARPF